MDLLDRAAGEAGEGADAVAHLALFPGQEIFVLGNNDPRASSWKNYIPCRRRFRLL